MKFDLHVHSTLSPRSTLTMQEIVIHAKSKGLDGVCITDHDTMAIKEVLHEGVQCNGIQIIFGVEYSTSQGDFLLFGPFESIKPGFSATELLEYVERHGGLAVAAHPFKKGKEVREELLKHQLCRFVEQVTDRNLDFNNNPTSNWNSLYDINHVGGSDAYNLAELGRVTTTFSENIESRADLIKALKKGAYTTERNQYYYS